VGSTPLYEAAKIGRDRFTQAILPIEQTFVLNQDVIEVLVDEQCQSLIAVLGVGVQLREQFSNESESVGQMFNIEKLRYEKIIIVTEQDEAGIRLRNELKRFFLTYMRPLVSAGHLVVLEEQLRHGFTQEEFYENVLSIGTRQLKIVSEGSG